MSRIFLRISKLLFFFLSNRVYLAKQVITSAAFILLQYNFKHALLGIILLKVNIFSVHSR